MEIRIKCLALICVISLLSVASLGAASTDLRLVEAAKHGDKEAVRSLLKLHADVNEREADGATALAWAAYQNDLEMAELLLAAGAKANTANDYGVTPLSLACDNASAAMVAKLLQGGADPNAATWAGETPLMACARTGSLDAVKSLLAHKADVNATENRDHHTALMWAVAQKHPDIVQALVDRGADVRARSKTGFTPLLFAAQQGDVDSARILLVAEADVNETTPEGDTPLLVATASGHEKLSIFLLEKGANPNAAEPNGTTALHYVALKGLTQIASFGPGIQNFHFAPYLYRPDMLELAKAIVEHGANPNARLVLPSVDGKPVPIENNIGMGYNKILKVYDPDRKRARPTWIGATPFLLAAVTNDANLMRILAAHGADVELGTETNVTPLMMAAGQHRSRTLNPLTAEEEQEALEAVEAAVELGAKVNATSNAGVTALHAAAMNGSNRIVEFLVEKGANVNAKDKSGQTPLEKALNLRADGSEGNNVNPVRNSTAELLLKLHATPMSHAVAQTSDAR